MKHPNEKKLEDYAAQRLSAPETTALILHFENCAECFGALQKLAPSARDQKTTPFTERAAEIFHLDYDEHLRPFVDKKADAATREIVESHAQNCSGCAFQLRELREFAESLRLREIERTLDNSPRTWAKMSAWLYQTARRRAFQIAFSFLLISLLGGGAFIVLKDENPARQAARTDNQKGENQIARIQTNANKTDQTIAETVNQNIRNNFPVNQINQNSVNAPKTPPPEKPQAAPVEDKSAELSSLPEALRGAIQTAVASQKIAFPGFLSAIAPANLKLRGAANDQPINLYPNGEAIRRILPRLSWENFASKGEKYVVEIFDERRNSVAISPPLSAENWTPKTALERGQIYRWEVRTEKVGETPKMFDGKFKILDQKSIDELANLRAKSSFVRAVVFASGGLLSEAEKAFRQAVKENDRAGLAKKFLRQIAKQR